MIKKLSLLILALSLSLAALAQPANDKPANAGKILLVVTNHGKMGNTDKPTGYWMSEVSHAWARFIDAGFSVDFASPNGGVTPMDPRSFNLEDADNKRLWGTRANILALAGTTKLSNVNAKDYKAVYFAGGHGTMWDFPDSADAQKIIREIYENRGVVSAVCHGPAALVNAKLSNGKYLVDGKQVAGFTDSEETASGLEKTVPFLLETTLRQRGANMQTAPNYKEKVAVDERLVTGQNPASAQGVADEVIKLLKK